MTGLEELENRLQRLEDERDIARLIASYGPLVDAAEPDGTSDLWTDDGVYDVDGWKLNGRSRIGEMVRSGAHQTLVAGGCCHFLGPCVVTLSGDTAVAVCESLILRKRDEEYVVFRASANHFELLRTAGGWRTVVRTTRLLDGGEVARRLLAAGVTGSPLPG